VHGISLIENSAFKVLNKKKLSTLIETEQMLVRRLGTVYWFMVYVSPSILSVAGLGAPLSSSLLKRHYISLQNE